MESVARASTAGSRRYSRGTASAFSFTPEQLGNLHNPKNLDAFYKLGGIDGLLAGLRTDRKGGLGAQPSKSIEVPNTTGPEEAVSGPSTRTTASSYATVPKPAPFPRQEQIAKIATGGSQDVALLQQRKVVFGDNRLPTRKQPGFLQLVWGAYNDPVLFLLTVAAVISLAIGLYQTFASQHSADNPAVEWVEGVAILVAVVVIVLVGSVNDWEKQRQFRKLNEKQLERDTKVVRFGELRLMPGSRILVGDIVRLEPGDLVPADGILLEGHNIACDESSATGESDLIHKTPGGDVFRRMTEGNRPLDLGLLAKLDPFMLSGTELMDGTGTLLVTATGIRSTYGKTLASLSDESDPTPLQARLAVLAKQIAWIGGVLAGLLFVALLIRFLVAIPHDTRPSAEKGKNFIDILIISLTVLVIAVPEGLPLAVTLSLAYATTRMLKDHNLVRQLKACETMGNATNICSDKTGTLTQNKMTVITGAVSPELEFQDLADAAIESKILASQDIVGKLAPDFKELLLQSIAINTTAFEGEKHAFVGSNTESALLSFARTHLDMGPVATERSKHKIVQLIPFSASRQCMVSVIELKDSPGTYRVLVKGAPEVLLSMTGRIMSDPSRGTNTVDMSSEQREWATNAIKNYGGQALRAIGLFYRDVQVSSLDLYNTPDIELDQTHLLKDLVFLGIFGIRDPLRPGVADAVRTCQQAGVTVRMVTGDNILTAKAIATQCGILGSGGDDIYLEGSSFRAMNDDQLKEIVPRLKVLARSSPEDKQKLVVLLKAMGEVVAVTGDGTNDASAMSAADVSFSMGGVSGTEVAREASSIILLTDDFTSIVKAIMWGRAVNDSVKKFLQFQITITVTSVLLAFVSAVSNAGEQSVLTPVQLMWINLFQDTLAALALATDRPQKRVLKRLPEAKMAPLITPSMWKMILGQSAYQLGVTLVLYFAGNRIFDSQTDNQIQQVETLVFNAYVWMQICNMYNCRQYDNTLNIFEGVLSNWLFMAVSSAMIGAQILIVFVGGQAFSVAWLTGPQWATSLILGLLSLAIGVLLRCAPDWPLEKMVAPFSARMRLPGFGSSGV